LCEGALVFVLLLFVPFESPRSGEFFFEKIDMAESDNILTRLQDLLVYLIPQLNKFPRDQKFVLGDRIETKLLDVQEFCLRAYYSREKRGHLLEPICNWKWRGIWCGWPMP
jgi:hypothetical protein